MPCYCNPKWVITGHKRLTWVVLGNLILYGSLAILAHLWNIYISYNNITRSENSIYLVGKTKGDEGRGEGGRSVGSKRSNMDEALTAAASAPPPPPLAAVNRPLFSAVLAFAVAQFLKLFTTWCVLSSLFLYVFG